MLRLLTHKRVLATFIITCLGGFISFWHFSRLQEHAVEENGALDTLFSVRARSKANVPKLTNQASENQLYIKLPDKQSFDTKGFKDHPKTNETIDPADHDKGEDKTRNHSAPPDPHQNRVRTDTGKSVSKLHWRDAAAANAVEIRYAALINQSSEIADILPNELWKALDGLGSVQSVDFWRLLKVNPELAFAFIGLPEPEWWAKELENQSEEGRQRLSELLAIHRASESQFRLKEAWQIHSGTILRLWAKGFIGAESLFMFRRTDDESREFDQWLGDLFGDQNINDRKRLVITLQMLISQGENIRSRMKTDDRFRATFAKSLWPSLLRVIEASKLPMATFVEHPRIWDLLQEQQGERLLREYGLIPAELFFGEPRYSKTKDSWGRIIYLLDLKRSVVIDALTSDRIRNLEQFRNFVTSRLLPQKLMIKVLASIMMSDDPKAIVAEYSAMTDKQIEAKLAVQPDIESWDDDLDPVLKCLKRMACFQQLDPGDRDRARNRAVSLALQGGSYAVDPTGTTANVVSLGERFANEWVNATAEADQQLRKNIARQADEPATVNAFREKTERIGRALAENRFLNSIFNESPRLRSQFEEQCLPRSIEYFHSLRQPCLDNLNAVKSRLANGGRIVFDKGRLLVWPKGAALHAELSDEDIRIASAIWWMRWSHR